MDAHDPGFDVVKERVGRVFDFLTAVSSSKDGPPLTLESDWQLPLDALPAHPAVQLRGSGDTDVVLVSVDRVGDAPCPSPPSELDEWLVPGWNRVDGPCAVLEARNLIASDGESVVERFDEEADREVRFTVWQRQRDQWLAAERGGDAARALYQRLFQLRSMMEREPDKHRLVLVDGFLACATASGDVVDAPLLSLDVELVFDAERLRLIISEGDAVPRLADVLLSTLLPQSGVLVADLQRIIDETGDIHPLETTRTDAFFAATAARLWPNAVVVNEKPSTTPNKPTVYRRPTLALLKRTAGLPVALSAFAADVKHALDVPDPLVRIVDPMAKMKPRSTTPVDLLFTKPSNEAQERIARLLAEHGAVVVQGPPGTGKTHTIANLVGHLLAHGKSVLVTSHTTKALRVLRDQVVPELQPLCVAVLDSDHESKKQLESSIHGIVERLGGDVAALEADAARLEKRRSGLQAELAGLRDELSRGRRAEYDSIVVAGEGKAPADAARAVAAAHGVDDWLPGPLLKPGAASRLSDAEVRELYRLNAELVADDDAAAVAGLPQPNEIFSPARAAEVFAAVATTPPGLQVRQWRREPDDEESVGGAQKSVQRLLASRRDEPWWRAAVDDGLRGQLAPWTLLRERTHAAIALAKQSADLWEHSVDLAGWSVADASAIVDELIDHVDGGGAFSAWVRFRNKEWARFIDTVRVDGARPESAEALRICRRHLQLHKARATLSATWDKVVAAAGGPPSSSLGVECEQAIERQLRYLDTADAWRAELDVVKAILVDVGLDWDRLPLSLPPQPQRGALDEAEALLVDCAQPALALALARLRHARLLEELKSNAARLHPWRKVAAVAGLIEALIQRDARRWQAGHEQLSRLLQKRAALARRQELLDKLVDAPTWREALQRRLAPHRGPLPPGDVGRAWLITQWREELDRRRVIDLDEVQQRIERVETELRTTTRAFVEARTWARQIRRTTPAQQNALLGWANAVKRLGKGTGKRADTIRREVRANLELSRQAVPVWILPLSRLIDSFTPGKVRFDVVIVDEASQADMSALFALGMADEAIVVGDHEQVSPLGVGEDVSRYNPLIEQYLKDIPNKALYDNRRSLYDAARECFQFAVLDEHFRCVKDIISFSNNLCYEGRVRPLRDESMVQRKPAVVAHRVAAGSYDEDRRVNDAEARETAALLVAATEQPEYRDATFGMISLLGDEQALAVDELLHRWLPANEYAKRRIVCGNAAHFQGDERDVMFLSLVRSSTGTPLMVQTKDEQKQRLNVAASRARDQMWVVHSLNPDVDLKPEDFRLRLLRHAEDPTATARAMAEQQHTESEFERRVLRHLVSAGYLNNRTQWRVGAWRLDIVVTGERGRVAIECDGDRFHPPESLERDLDRQRILERLGWRFIRIRGSEFFTDETRAMKRVVDRLRQLDVLPGAALSTATVDASELRRRVVARAEALMTERATTAPTPTTTAPAVRHWSRKRPTTTAPAEVKPSPPTEKPQTEKPQPAKQPPTLKPQPSTSVQLELEAKPVLGATSRPTASAPPPEAKPSMTAPKPGASAFTVVAPAPSSRKPFSPRRGARLAARLQDALDRIDAARFHAPVCRICRAQAVLTARDQAPAGIFIECGDRACSNDDPLDELVLAQLAAELGARCFDCQGPLKTMKDQYGSRLICTVCKRKNTWHGINDRS